ncbi:hypothetical protein [Bacteroides sp.]|uniref:hypothetical protein n=1 Tax=Bacteroides sp. TaxID=29523 RepID=UPI003AB60DDC
MEIHQIIIASIIMLFTTIGFVVSIIYVVNYFWGKDEAGVPSLPAKMEYMSTDTPYKDLWRDAGCSIYADMSIAGFCNLDLGHCKDKESLYRTELIRLIKEGKDKSLYVPPDDRNIDLRKFCIERTMPMFGNMYRDTVGMLRTTDMLYNYILTGKIPENKKEN